MATVTVTTRIVVDDPQSDRITREFTKTVASLTTVQEFQRTLVTATTISLWDPTVSGTGVPADFDILVLVSDQTVLIEFTIDEGNANEQLLPITLAAGQPLVLCDDAAIRGTYTGGDGFTGTTDVIDKLRVKNASGSTATLYLLIGT